MIIKVCGMLDAANIREVSMLGVDMIGLNFCPDNPRFVKMISSRAGIIPDYSEERLHDLRQQEATANVCNKPSRVGVFANDMPQNIVTRVYNYQLDYVQLDGEESPVMIKNLLKTLKPDIKSDIKIIKTIAIETEEDFAQSIPYEEFADIFLFVPKPSANKPFDWNILSAYSGSTPFLISDSIEPCDKKTIKSFYHPKFIGINLYSQFETEPGIKDIDKLRTFIEEIKSK